MVSLTTLRPKGWIRPFLTNNQSDWYGSWEHRVAFKQIRDSSVIDKDNNVYRY